jgi:hypothetical protein
MFKALAFALGGIINPSRLVAVLWLGALSAGPGAAQQQCIVEVSPAIFGLNMTALFDIRSGESCVYGVNFQGTVFTAEISQSARHGRARMVDLSTWAYEAPAGFRGRDSFAITARGQSLGERPGTSVIAVDVNVN